jgi:hypothetical protein
MLKTGAPIAVGVVGVVGAEVGAGADTTGLASGLE